ncbi:hypothetical protein [Streptomyces sp. NPDC002205]|uniref:hypothetical protein n=1 Tax=Streptomyces sp. NPDC002205 TaxID=3154411 RepID=UPI00332D1E5F
MISPVAQVVVLTPGMQGLSLASEMLEKFGYEPERTAPTLLWLRNCHFHPLAAKAPELVCAVNLAFLAWLGGRTVDGTALSGDVPDRERITPSQELPKRR